MKWVEFKEHPVLKLVLNIGMSGVLLWLAFSVPSEKEWMFHASAWASFVYSVLLIIDAARDLRRWQRKG